MIYFTRLAGSQNNQIIHCIRLQSKYRKEKMMSLHDKMGLFLLIISFFTVFPVHAHEIKFNNGSAQDYAKASSLKGDVRKIQEQTKGLWPRSSQGTIYSAGNSELSITENNKFLIFKTNNLPDHELSTTNPNCAVEQSYKFLIPKTPKRLSSPATITKKMQEIGIALNGVVIAGPYDSQNKIAPYNRIVDQCSSHADPQGMYHYHFAPLCMKDNNGSEIAVDETKQIGWAFDGYSIKGLADRETHLPEIDTCNGHKHDGDYHYHVTRDFPFFMGCYQAEPQSSNFSQKASGSSASSSSCPSGVGGKQGNNNVSLQGQGSLKKRPNFDNAALVLKVSEQEIKKALGPPPGDFARASKKLEISQQELRNALQLN